MGNIINNSYYIFLLKYLIINNDNYVNYIIEVMPEFYNCLPFQ